jgi:hypothetical protein
MLKSEIERQVQDMLEAGLIQHRIVKKKNSTYRLCVNYKHLNAITQKGQFPVSIIEELVDELQQACWFSTLDLCARFHQIQMNPFDSFKSAFQTHVGHYEFRVMSFGLTGAPHSFQKTMNSTMSPFLRKFVLVFFMIFLYIANPTLSTWVILNKCSKCFKWRSGQSRFLNVHLLNRKLLI